MPFTKGQSGNPAGRPKKGSTLTEALESALEKKGKGGKLKRTILADTLIDLAINARNIAAIKYMMDRVDGRPTESIELTDGAVDQRLREIMDGR
jgi:hypothetical protein